MDEGPLDAAIRLAGEIVVSDAPGDRVRQARTRYGFTQTWLAPHLDVRRESLSRIESGHSNPTLGVVSRFARLISLARHVRSEAARLEGTPQDPDPAGFRAVGRQLGLADATTVELAQRAIEAYDEKRRELLEGIEPTGGSR